MSVSVVNTTTTVVNGPERVCNLTSCSYGALPHARILVARPAGRRCAADWEAWRQNAGTTPRSGAGPPRMRTAFPVDEAWIQQPGRAPGRRGGSYERPGIRPKYPDARGVGPPVVRLGSCVTGRGIYCPFRQIADKRLIIPYMFWKATEKYRTPASGEDAVPTCCANVIYNRVA